MPSFIIRMKTSLMLLVSIFTLTITATAADNSSRPFGDVQILANDDSCKLHSAECVCRRQGIATGEAEHSIANQ